MTDKEKIEGIRELAKIPNIERSSWKSYALAIEQRLLAIGTALDMETKDDLFSNAQWHIYTDPAKPILRGRYICPSCRTEFLGWIDACPNCKIRFSQ